MFYQHIYWNLQINYYLKNCFLLGWISSVKGQNCGSCVAFATMGALEATLIKAGADPDSVDLSEQWLLDCSPRGGLPHRQAPPLFLPAGHLQPGVQSLHVDQVSLAA